MNKYYSCVCVCVLLNVGKLSYLEEMEISKLWNYFLGEICLNEVLSQNLEQSYDVLVTHISG